MNQIPFKYRLTYGYFQVLDKIFGRKTGFKLSRKKRKASYESLERHLKKNRNNESYIPIIQEENINNKTFKKKYLKKGIPVVLKGAAKNWDCVKNWSLDYFENLHGEDEITLVGNDNTEQAFEILKLKDLIQDIQNKGKKYFRFYPLLKEHPEHIADFDYKWLKTMRNKRGFYEQFQVFMGGSNSYTPMHNAMASNLFVQAYGEKTWFLYAPQVSMIIDPLPGKNMHRSAPFKAKEGPFNPFMPNFSPPYHLYQYIRPYKVTLSPGDILFNPPHWWHAVINDSDSIGIGYRWANLNASIKTAPFYTFLDMISLPFNKNFYRHRKTDYQTLHLVELGVYDEYLKRKNQQKKDNN